MTEGHLCFYFVNFLLFPFLPHFLRQEFSVMNSGPVFVLNLFDFCKKRKKILLFNYICIWWYSRGGALVTFDPGMLATEWDLGGWETYLSSFLILFYVAHFDTKVLSLRSKSIKLNLQLKRGNHSVDNNIVKHFTESSFCSEHDSNYRISMTQSAHEVQF